MLNLAGTNPIPYGQTISGNTEMKRKYVYGHRDRADEVRDFARSVRAKYLYIRNYMPHLDIISLPRPDIGEIRHEFQIAKSVK